MSIKTIYTPPCPHIYPAVSTGFIVNLLKVPCSYQVSAIGKFALLRYLSEMHFKF